MPEELNIVLKASDILKKSDFTTAFREVLEVVLRREKLLERAVAELQRTYNALIDRISKDHDVNLKDLKTKTNQLFVQERLTEMTAEQKRAFGSLEQKINSLIDKKMSEADERMGKLKDGERGIQGLPGPEGKPPRELIERFSGIEDKIKNLHEAVKRQANMKGMGRAKIQFIRAVDLTSSVDGSTSAFTLPPDTVGVLGVWSSQFPITFRQDVDWTFSGRTLTLVTAQVGIPQAGQTLWALCDVLFYP